MTELDDGGGASYDFEHLKTLRGEQLSVALLGAASQAARQAPEEERKRMGDAIMEICWAADAERNQAVIDEDRAAINGIFYEIYGVPAYSADEDAASSGRDQAVAALGAMVDSKRELESGLGNGRGYWSDDDTYYLLNEICSAQERVGIAAETDYVRDTAVKALEDPLYLGTVLLRNALGGDDESYGLGLKALREAVDVGDLGWDEAYAGLKIAMAHIRDHGAEDDELLGLSIDMLALLREWTLQSGTHLSNYVELAAELAMAVDRTP